MLDARYSKNRSPLSSGGGHCGGGLVWSSGNDEPVPGVRGLKPGRGVGHFLMPGILDPLDLFYFKADIGQERNYFFAHEAFCRAVTYVNDTVRRREDLGFKQAIDRAQGLVVLVTIFDIAANDGVVCVKDRFHGWYDYEGESVFLCCV